MAAISIHWGDLYIGAPDNNNIYTGSWYSSGGDLHFRAPPDGDLFYIEAPSGCGRCRLHHRVCTVHTVSVNTGCGPCDKSSTARPSTPTLTPDAHERILNKRVSVFLTYLRTHRKTLACGCNRGVVFSTEEACVTFQTCPTVGASWRSGVESNVRP